MESGLAARGQRRDRIYHRPRSADGGRRDSGGELHPVHAGGPGRQQADHQPADGTVGHGLRCAAGSGPDRPDQRAVGPDGGTAHDPHRAAGGRRRLPRAVGPHAVRRAVQSAIAVIRR